MTPDEEADMEFAAIEYFRLRRELRDAKAELEVLQEWHAQHGMDCEVAKRPGFHVWSNAPGSKKCWCPHGVSHFESPLTLHERKKHRDKVLSEKDTRYKVAAEVERRFDSLGTFHPYKPFIPLVADFIRGEQ